MGIENQDADFESGYSEKPTETPAAAAPIQEIQKPDPAVEKLAAADPIKELMARFEKFEAGHNKLAGHIGGLQRTQQEIQQTLAAASAATKAVADAPTQAQINEAVKSTDKWDALVAQYPDFTAAVDQRMASQKTPAFDVDAFEAKIAKEIAGKTEAMQERIIHASLNAVFPGWVKETQSPPFKAWMDSQPETVKALGASDDVGDAATMLKLYEASKTAKPAPAPQAPHQKDNSPRKERLAAAIAPRGTGGHASGSSEIDEFESGYNG